MRGCAGSICDLCPELSFTDGEAKAQRGQDFVEATQQASGRFRVTTILSPWLCFTPTSQLSSPPHLPSSIGQGQPGLRNLDLTLALPLISP